MTMEVRNLLIQAMLDMFGHGSGDSTPRRPNPVVILTPPPYKQKELPKLLDISSQASAQDHAEMAEASLEGVPTTISPIAATTRFESITPSADVAELKENANKALKELLAMKASIDAHRQRAVWELGMELHQNESKATKSLKEAMPSVPMLPRILRPCALQLLRGQRSPTSEPSKKPRPPKPAPSGRPELLALQPSGILRLRGYSQAKLLQRQHGKIM